MPLNNCIDPSFDPGHDNYTAEYEPRGVETPPGEIPEHQIRLYTPVPPHKFANDIKIEKIPFTLVRFDGTQQSVHSAIRVACGELHRQHKKHWPMDFETGDTSTFLALRVYYDASFLSVISLKDHPLSDQFNGVYTLRHVHKPFTQQIEEATAAARADWARILRERNERPTLGVAP